MVIFGLKPVSLQGCGGNRATFLLPWGKYRYTRMPMGIKTATDIFQEVMAHVLGDLPCARIYLGGCLALADGAHAGHCEKLQEVLSRLGKFNFRCRPGKCEFAAHFLFLSSQPQRGLRAS